MVIKDQFLYLTENCDRGAIREIDLQRGRIKIIAGNFSDDGIKDGPALSSNLYKPTRLNFDKAGNLYIGGVDHRFRFLNMTSMVMSTFVGFNMKDGGLDGPVSSAQFSFPRRISFDSKDTMYAIDRSPKVRKIAYQ